MNCHEYCVYDLFGCEFGDYSIVLGHGVFQDVPGVGLGLHRFGPDVPGLFFPARVNVASSTLVASESGVKWLQDIGCGSVAKLGSWWCYDLDWRNLCCDEDALDTFLGSVSADTFTWFEELSGSRMDANKVPRLCAVAVPRLVAVKGWESVECVLSDDIRRTRKPELLYHLGPPLVEGFAVRRDIAGQFVELLPEQVEPICEFAVEH